MATREFLQYFREARGGDGTAQLALGKSFLRGEKGTAPNITSALIWLTKAAKQGLDEAVQLIAEHVPLRISLQYPDAGFILHCYRSVGLKGSSVARWQFVQWILNDPNAQHAQSDVDLALVWIQNLAHGGSIAACWRFAQLCCTGQLVPMDMEKAIHYARLAATGGECEAMYWLAQQSLTDENKADLLKNVEVLIPQLLAQTKVSQKDAQLLFEYASYNFANFSAIPDPSRKMVIQALHHSARSGLAQAQFLYGLWLGQLDQNGERYSYAGAEHHVSNLKKAAQWLGLAAEQNYADAWYVLAMLYRRTQFSQYDAKQSDYCLLQAAQLGHGVAQLKLAKHLWRTRNSQTNADVRACNWFWRSAQQGVSEAAEWLRKVAQSCPDPAQNKWFKLANFGFEQRKADEMALLIHRIQIANQFDLDKAEMLLLDVMAARQENCLVVDIQSWLPRSTRRFILIETPAQHLALLQAVKIFSENKLAINNEGNYRQRRYRLEKLLSWAALDDEGSQRVANKPNSNNRQSGIASTNCDSTSGGVTIAENIKDPTIT